MAKKANSDIKKLLWWQKWIMQKESWVYCCYDIPFGIKHRRYKQILID